jgi:hypothetical protein
MADKRIPEEVIDWMSNLNWGNHHLEYHIVKRYDIFQFRANQGDSNSLNIMRFIQANNWNRASIQEGADGDGLQFLAMHRAMIQMIKNEFPQHSNFLIGWTTPPTDPNDPNDPVPNGSLFNSEKLKGIELIESNPDFFDSEDHFGLFIQTTLRPTSSNPLNVRSDMRYGVHNYLHGRWTDNNSPINIGNPSVNIFNRRFWKLHGWIDGQWTAYRRAKGISDNNNEYIQMIEHYIHMMSGHHHMMADKKMNEMKFELSFENFFSEFKNKRS